MRDGWYLKDADMKVNAPLIIACPHSSVIGSSLVKKRLEPIYGCSHPELEGNLCLLCLKGVICQFRPETP